MVEDKLVQELYKTKKELLRCYQYILDLQQKLNSFPEEEIHNSIKDIKQDIDNLEVDIQEIKYGKNEDRKNIKNEFRNSNDCIF